MRILSIILTSVKFEIVSKNFLMIIIKEGSTETSIIQQVFNEHFLTLEMLTP